MTPRVDAPSDVPVTQMPLSAAQRHWLALDWEMTAAYPGSCTTSENWSVQSAMRGWEFVEGTAHQALTGASGQTDASALHHLGIPTVRLGYPPSLPFQQSGKASADSASAISPTWPR